MWRLTSLRGKETLIGEIFSLFLGGQGGSTF